MFRLLVSEGYNPTDYDNLALRNSLQFGTVDMVEYILTVADIDTATLNILYEIFKDMEEYRERIELLIKYMEI